MSPPEIRLPELDGKTPKMYRGGKICCDVHFNPLWGKHAPSYGIAHAMALGVSIHARLPSVVSSVAGGGDPPPSRIRFAVMRLLQTSQPSYSSFSSVSVFFVMSSQYARSPSFVRSTSTSNGMRGLPSLANHFSVGYAPI